MNAPVAGKIARLSPGRRPFLSRTDLRTLLTVLMYAGVALFFVPFLWGHEHHALRVQAGGALAAVVFGLSRCLFTEEDCWWHVSR